LSFAAPLVAFGVTSAFDDFPAFDSFRALAAPGFAAFDDFPAFTGASAFNGLATFAGAFVGFAARAGTSAFDRFAVLTGAGFAARTGARFAVPFDGCAAFFAFGTFDSLAGFAVALTFAFVFFPAAPRAAAVDPFFVEALPLVAILNTP